MLPGFISAQSLPALERINEMNMNMRPGGVSPGRMYLSPRPSLVRILTVGCSVDRGVEAYLLLAGVLERQDYP